MNIYKLGNWCILYIFNTYSTPIIQRLFLHYRTEKLRSHLVAPIRFLYSFFQAYKLIHCLVMIAKRGAAQLQLQLQLQQQRLRCRQKSARLIFGLRDTIELEHTSSRRSAAHYSSLSSGQALLVRPSPRSRGVFSQKFLNNPTIFTCTDTRQFSSTPFAMTATKIDGTAIAKKIRERIHTQIENARKSNPRYKPSLKIIQGE